MARSPKYHIDNSAGTLQFTRNWFVKRNLETFRTHVLPTWRGRQCLYLEIGVFEGQSLVWMMQHVLTHPRSRAVASDPWLCTTKLTGDFMEDVRQRAIHNLKPYGDKCTLIRGNSAEVLRRMCGKGGYEGVQKGTVDLAMIDGDHNELAVLDDARHVIELVKVGGWILFDDVENDRPKDRHVKQGVELFLAEFGGRVKRLWKHKYVECFERLS